MTSLWAAGDKVAAHSRFRGTAGWACGFISSLYRIAGEERPKRLKMAPEAGLEPATCRLTAGRSTIELLWISRAPYLTTALRAVNCIWPSQARNGQEGPHGLWRSLQLSKPFGEPIKSETNAIFRRHRIVKADSAFLLESAAWPAFLVDGGGTIRQANQAAIAWFGSKLESDSTMLSALWAEEVEPSEHFLARCERFTGTAVPLKLLGKGAAVTTFPTYIATFHWEGEKRFIFQLFPELASKSGENKAPVLEANLAHKQKLDCALQLARTVALDFNNALTTILGHTSLVLSEMENAHPWRGSLVEVEKAAGKAAEVVNQLGAFSRAEKDLRAVAGGNLNALLRRVVEVFQRADTTGITWLLDLESRIYSAKFDEAKIQQVLVKILENAVEAINQRGQISVTSRNLEIAVLTHDGTVRLEPGSYVCSEIIDNGRGMEPEVLPRIFEPFFTTKPGHRGLGLAWVYGILTNHGGGVTVASQPSRGASVRLYLPASKKLLLEGAIPLDDLRGDQVILMVDDEDLVLNMGRTILSAFGYQVLAASGGRQALEILSTTPSPVDLVITDLVMPQMSGRELMDQIQALFPCIPIICTSGYIRAAGKENASNFLQKPFTSQELLRRVKQVLAVTAAAQESNEVSD